MIVGFLQLVALAFQARALLHHSGLLRESVGQMQRAVSAYQGYITVAQQSNELTREATGLTRQSLVLTHRPKLIVRNIVARRFDEETEMMQETDVFQAGAYIGGTFQISNIGQSRATIGQVYSQGLPREFVSGTGGTEIPPHGRPYEGLRGNANPGERTLAPGQSTIVEFRSEKPLTEIQVSCLHYPVGAVRCKIYVLGWIEYSDDLGIVRRTDFCREYNPLACRFEPVDNPDYEHAD